MLCRHVHAYPRALLRCRTLLAAVLELRPVTDASACTSNKTSCSHTGRKHTASCSMRPCRHRTAFDPGDLSVSVPSAETATPGTRVHRDMQQIRSHSFPIRRSIPYWPLVRESALVVSTSTAGLQKSDRTRQHPQHTHRQALLSTLSQPVKQWLHRRCTVRAVRHAAQLHAKCLQQGSRTCATFSRDNRQLLAQSRVLQQVPSYGESSTSTGSTSTSRGRLVSRLLVAQNTWVSKNMRKPSACGAQSARSTSHRPAMPLQLPGRSGLMNLCKRLLHTHAQQLCATMLPPTHSMLSANAVCSRSNTALFSPPAGTHRDGAFLSSPEQQQPVSPPKLRCRGSNICNPMPVGPWKSTQACSEANTSHGCCDTNVQQQWL